MSRVDEDEIRTHILAICIEKNGRQFGVRALNVATNESVLLRSKSAVYVRKLHTVPYVFLNLPDDQHTALRRIEYSPWLVAAIQLNKAARLTTTYRNKFCLTALR